MEWVVLLGAPGSGKGTVATRLIERYADLALIVAGDLLRDAVRRATAAGREAAEIMRHGGLVPDDLIGELMGEWMDAHQVERCLLDGFPRTTGQAAILDAMAAERKARLRSVVLLEVPEAIILERVQGRRICPNCARVYHLLALPPSLEGICDACGTTLVMREDDRPETVRNRLRVYAAHTAGLIDLYEKRGLLLRINGVGSVPDVAERVDRALS